MSDIVISGYYGLGNSGDEALLKSIVSDLRKISPDVTVTALSGNAQMTERKYNIATVGRFNVFSVFRELKKAKMLISGGGTLIQDATSTKSLLYYLGIIYLAKKLGLKIMLYANGLGPIKDKNVKLVEKVLNKADVITLRENISLDEIKRCNITKPEIHITADPAFNLVPSSEERLASLMEKFNIPQDKPLIAVSVREWQGLKECFAEQIASVLDNMCEKGYFPVFVPMQLSSDLNISLEIANKMQHRSSIVDEEIEVSDMLGIIGKSDIACGMRLHMLIFASVMKIPMAGIVYDPKIKGFMDYMGQTTYVELDNFSQKEFFDALVYCHENKSEMKNILSQNFDSFKKKADENAKLAVKLLKS
ncbi:MAG: polysaccharide pyruvyl transferase CsaB [Clostridia bacterium]|nr:polysaccharide pyruvyl transferase CsaB [Clostridia bacterium]